MSESTDTVPAINKTAFSCPHCDAYTTQYWSRIFSGPYPEERRTPFIPDSSVKEQIGRESPSEEKVYLIGWVDRMMSGKIFMEKENGIVKIIHGEICSSHLLENLNISKCYNCEEIAIWVHDRLIYPSIKIEIQPNQDLPSHIKRLFEEAREIVTSSPRGAAALLRLSIQYLCKELGETGKNINKDIANLVAKGLNPLVQQALDVVRVVGNEAVHPGEIDLDDNRDTALQLFNLVNLICNQMITHPKQVQVMYNTLPENKLKEIEQRDRNAGDNNGSS
uniref:DUF4145 domain-containing protein n=1 Tax=Candidatus Kentrum eta TaxID=2126337 RepID=A0A450VHF7_9GAMM|nr:MAG: protein of unknown function (DUF4145) [Candidatus Kentron sp. H]VFJ99833.1 MAG: protein of unknown function (DUF4145) [Candidatus Kentron sp. H]VFK04272.1 MAG: protein of unknown function (DUF4145) [Candidatus Kentron sp. H]